MALLDLQKSDRSNAESLCQKLRAEFQQMIEETDSRVTIKIKEANRILSTRVTELDAKTD